MSRTPLTRVTPEAGARMTPRKSGRGDQIASRSFGDRRWPATDYGSGRYAGGDRTNRHSRPDYVDPGYGQPGYDHRPGYGRPPYYHRPVYPCGPSHYPYYERYGYYTGGCYRPYYYPSYAYAYPYFVPTFSFGLGYWDTPTYYSEPTVIYTQPTTVVGTPAYYSQPEATYYGDSGTTYIDSQTYPAPSVEGSGSTYVERQISAPSAPPTIGMPPTTAPPVQQPAPQQEATARQPDQGVLAAVGQGNEHFGAGRFTDARRSYGEAMAIDDTDGIAKLLYGLASFAEGDYVAATASIRHAMKATPDLVYYPFNIKALYRDQMKFQEHLAALAQHADVRPGDQDAQFLLGCMWYASGDAQNAATKFGSLALNHPDEKLYAALRDASKVALESLSKQPPQSAQTQPTP